MERLTYNGQFLKEEDFVKGFNLNFALYKQYINTKKELKYTKEEWNNRTFTDITGKKHYKKEHELFKYRLYNLETRKIYKIDGIFKQHYFGYYFDILFVDENGSHGLITYKNISSIDSTIIEKSNNFNTKYKLIL